MSVLRRAGHPHAVGDVVVHRLPRKQAEVLEHHRHAGDRFSDDLIADADFAGVVRDQPVNAAQHRGLAAAGRPDHRDDLAFADVEVDVAEHFERAVALAEAAHTDARRAARGALQRRRWAHSAACVCGLALTLAQ